MSNSVLVLGCDARSGLAIIRSLGRAGIAVDVGWLTGRLASKSRYVRNILDLPDPSGTSRAWLDALKDLLIKYEYDLVLPCHDRAIIPIQQNKVELGKHARIYVLADEAYLATFNKYHTQMLAERCGVRLPRWAHIRSPQEIAAVELNFTFPIVLKPISSFSLERATERRAVRTIRDKSDFAPVLQKMLRDGPVQIQEFFGGKGFGVEILAKDGQVLAAFQHERMHEPLNGGGSSYRRSTVLDTRLLDAAKALLASLRYTGVIMVEFLVNPKSNDWILVETNGRFWGSLPLALVSGVDFPLYLYQMLVCGRTEFPKTYKVDVYCRNLTLDLQWFKKNLKADRNDPTLQLTPLRHVWGELLKGLLSADHIDTFALDDPMPFFNEVGDLAVFAIKALSKQATRLAGVSRIMKMQRARRAVTKFRHAKKITFVCYGNICRSAFAEAYARSIAPKGITFCSAGTFARIDRRPPDEARAVAKAFGVDLEDHRSKVLSTSLATESDIIVVFDHQNLKDVSREYPQIKSRIARLGDFLPGSGTEVADPYDQPLERYAHCFQLIADLLSQIWPVRDVMVDIQHVDIPHSGELGAIHQAR
jgi:protein-tyrosine-phosphatase/predicted ATP-grasp superfamily ATP-dependent carboligase